MMLALHGTRSKPGMSPLPLNFIFHTRVTQHYMAAEYRVFFSRWVLQDTLFFILHCMNAYRFFVSKPQTPNIDGL